MSAVLQGRVTRAGAPVKGAYVRLLDRTGELTGEAVTTESGDFRFQTDQGEWTLRALSPTGSVDLRLATLSGRTSEAELAIPA
jgi:uncharacterized protein YfaS (alpha-2-macroglobulin family)